LIKLPQTTEPVMRLTDLLATPREEVEAEAEAHAFFAATPPPYSPETSLEPHVVRAASWSHKMAAAMLDGAVGISLTLGYAVVLAMELPAGEAADPGVVLSGVDYALDLASRHSAMMLSMGLAFATVVALYEALSVAVLGCTVGQKLMGLRLIRLSGARVGAVRALARGFLCGCGLMLLGAGWVWAPFDRRRMALHDKWTGLVLIEVLRAPPAPTVLDAVSSQDVDAAATPPAA
jgi:hypothetical protein